MTQPPVLIIDIISLQAYATSNETISFNGELSDSTCNVTVYCRACIKQFDLKLTV